MDFGKLADISRVDWRLPVEDPLSREWFAARRSEASKPRLEIYYGAPAWNHKEWVGRVYPAKTRSADYLHFYSRYFSCIEMNAVHYRIPTPEQAEKWRSQVEPGFLFCPKVFKGISHVAGGLRDRALHLQWFQFLSGLKENRGPSFLQLPPHFDYGSKAELFQFLQNWPDEFRLSIELRHPSWFQNGRVLPGLVQYLQKREMGLVILDVAGRRDLVHGSVSADSAMVRFIGNDLDPSDFTRAAAWTHRFLEWEKMGLKKLFLFIHEPDDIQTPEMTQFFLKQLREIGRWPYATPVIEPRRPSEQLGLEL